MSASFVVAARILARFGADIEQAICPISAQSNEVWLTPQVVLRMGANGDGALLREARLATVMPQEVGYPAVLGSGVLDGYEWVVAERLPGVDLGVLWATMDDADRRNALEDLWARLAAVHRTDIAQAQRLGCTSTPFYALDQDVAMQQLRFASDEAAINRDLTRWIENILGEMFAAIQRVPQALAHTDAHQSNTIWDGCKATPIDFEFACVGPCDLDLENLFRSFTQEPSSSAGLYLADLARQDLARHGSRYRIVGYAVLRDLWALCAWLRTAPSRDDLEAWEPWLNLRGHAMGTSWLAQLWD